MVKDTARMWWDGVRALRTRWWIVFVVLAAALCDGVSTYLVLHPEQNSVFAEGNAAAVFVMGFLGTNGYIVVSNIGTVIGAAPVLASRPPNVLARMVWAGCAAAVGLKFLAGAWNTYLLYTFG